jgi:transposase-like protein
LLLKRWQKTSCWACSSLYIIGWGFQNGKQRFRCRNCGIYFTSTNLGVRKSNRKVWFKRWISDKRSLEDLSQDSGYSTSTLKRYFHDYLSEYPRLSVFPSEKVNLLIDGTYFKNDLCLIVYRDNTIKFTQLYRLTDGEWYDEIKEDLENLIKLGVNIESITCDGHKSLLKAIKKVCKGIVVQRCIIHIQRMCRIWLSAKPKSEAGIELRRIVSRLHLVNTQDEKGYWIVSFVKWYEKHELFVNAKSYKQETGRYWYTHTMVRRSFSVIKKALPDMFHYLDNPQIPKSTNGLESFFGHLKANLNIHRGLSKEHRKNFIRWYLYFRNSSSSRFS